MSDIDEVLSKIDKKTKERVQKAIDINVEYLPTPSVSLNRALNGGFAFGRQVMLYGNKSSGKSSCALQMVAEAQRQGKSCLWVDAEKTFEPEWAERLGVDVEKLLVIQVSDSMRVADTTAEFLSAGIDVVVVDSITVITPMSYFEKDSLELKGMSATRQIGTSARDLSESVRLWNQTNEGSLLILISQERNNLGSMYVSSTSTGGKAPRFYSSTIVKLWSSESLNNAIKGQVQTGDYIVEEPIGRKVTWTIENNKTGKPFQQGEYDFYFDGPFVGVDTLADVIDQAIKFGLVKKSGNWYTVDGVQLNGRAKLVEHFRSLPDDFEALKEEVLNYGRT